MQRSMDSKLPKIHFWIPNVFEFKGGIQVYLYDFLTVLSKNLDIYKITVHDKLDCGFANFKVPDQIRFAFYGHYPSRLRKFCFALGLFFDAIRDRPSLIICSHLRFAPVALLIHKLLGIPYWIIVYGIDAWNISNVLRKDALKCADKIISIGEYTRDRLIREQNLPPAKFRILPVTFDADKFKVGSKSQYLLDRYNLQPDQAIILTVCRLESREKSKSYDQVMAALQIIRRMIPNTHYLLVGEGSDRGRIEKLVNQLDLKDNVTLTGFIPDEELCDHYNLCDIFAMPSKSEGFGIVYLEAMACGKPCIGGNQDGAIDALSHGELGILVDPDNIDAIAIALLSLLRKEHPNPILFQPESLRREVIYRFGFEQFKQKLQEYLEDF